MPLVFILVAEVAEDESYTGAERSCSWSLHPLTVSCSRDQLVRYKGGCSAIDGWDDRLGGQQISLRARSS